MPVQIGSKTSDFSDPTGLMSDCHRRIEMFLNALKAAADFDGRQLADEERRALDAALRYFREAAPKHNADEEQSLFPRLRSIHDSEVESVLADVARLEQEHRWAAPLHAEIELFGLQWLKEGRLAPEEARGFRSTVAELVSMYRTHIDFEDRVFFPLGRDEVLASPAPTLSRKAENTRRHEAGFYSSDDRCFLDGFTQFMGAALNSL
jgi:hemerythrin-like domain-containing protein